MRLFCSICKDIYIPCSEVHVTNCGHLYHGSCISTWTKHHRTCPQCRASVSQPFRIYFDVEKGEEIDRVTLERQIEVLMDRLHVSEKCNKNLLDEKKNLLDEKKNFEKTIVDMKEGTVSLTKKNDVLRMSLTVLKEELRRLLKKNECVSRLQGEVESLKAKVSILGRVETLIKGSAEEVNKMIESTPVTALAVKQLCTYVGVLKDQLSKIENRNVDLIKENREISRALAEEKEKPFKENGIEELIRSLRDKNRELENELNSLNMSFNDYKSKYSKKFKSIAPLRNQESSKKNLVDLSLESFLEEEYKNTEFVHPVKQNRTEDVHPDSAITKWQELICAGPIQNLALSKTRSFGTALYDKDDNGTSRLATSYGYDGFGGRKKIKLGGPTPVAEFEKIKQKKKDKKGVQAVPQKKILDYFQLD